MSMTAKRSPRTLGAVALSLGIGCGGTLPATQPSQDPAATSAEIQQDLTKLQALDVVDVGNLVLQLPAAATACYGVPCPGSGWQAPYDQERARQAGRLDKLVQLATAAKHDPYLPLHGADEAAAAVAALQSLAVVQVNDVVTTQPQASAACYNQPCPDDVAAADAENARRVTVAFGIVDAARKAGL